MEDTQETKCDISKEKERFSITNWLIVTNVCCFGVISPFNLSYFGLQPNAFLKGERFWSLLTHMFIHVNLWHLLINIVVLFYFGNFYEKIIGRKRYLGFYLISGIMAGLTFVFLAYFWGNTDLNSLTGRIFGSPASITIGASGAIFAIVGLMVILNSQVKLVIIFLPFFSLPAYLMGPLGLSIMWLISGLFGAPIANTAHLGGFLFGIGFGLYLKYKYGEKYRKILEELSKGNV